MAVRQYTIKSSKEHVSPMVESVMEFIKDETNLADCECIRDIKVVLNELLANAVIHGNECNPEKPVDVNVAIETETVHIKVTDRGPAFVPDKNSANDILCESGRGIGICHILCRKLDYSFEKGKGNTATAAFYIKD